MRIPELFYAPTQKGLEDLAPRRYMRTVEVSAAAATLVATHPFDPSFSRVTLENIFVVTGWQVFAQGGGAQNVNDIQVRAVIRDNVGNVQLITDVDRLSLLAVQQAQLVKHDAELVLLPDEGLQGSVLFSAAVAINTIRVSVFGWLLNRGNVQHGGF